MKGTVLVDQMCVALASITISVGETAVATTYTHAHLTRVMPAEIQYASQLSGLFKRKTADTLGHHTAGSPHTGWVIYKRK